jgi:hypothetical protein
MVYVSEMRGTNSRITHTPAAETAASFAELCRDVEAEFGFERVLPEVGLRILPDLQVSNLRRGEVTLFQCLFTPSPW